MKILLINKFHYMKGGTETFHFALAEALEAQGHEVIFFSMQDNRNIPCNQTGYFVKKVDYNDNDINFLNKIKLGISLIYSVEAKRKIKALIEQEKPDIAHISLLHRQLSFSVVDELKNHNIPIVMHLHELSAICPAYTMLRPDGSICERCLGGDFKNCVTNKCMKGSYGKSLLAYIEAKFLRYGNYYNKIDLYIAECDFYKELAERSKFTASPIIRMNNFLPVNQIYQVSNINGGYILYFGRYAREKGVITLLRAYSKIDPPYPLRCIGSGPEQQAMVRYIQDNDIEGRVSIEGPAFGHEMDAIIESSTIVVIPSEWYENGAFVALQALAKGKVVVATRIAGLAEIIEDENTGFLAEPKNADSLAAAIKKAIELPDQVKIEMGKRSVEMIKKRCDWKEYIIKMENYYRALIETGSNSESLN